jgi:hypothetical protein
MEDMRILHCSVDSETLRLLKIIAANEESTHGKIIAKLVRDYIKKGKDSGKPN